MNNDNDISQYVGRGLTSEEAMIAKSRGLPPGWAAHEKGMNELAELNIALTAHPAAGYAGTSQYWGPRISLRELRQFLVRLTVGVAVMLVLFVLLTAAIVMRSSESRMRAAFSTAALLTTHDNLPIGEASELQRPWFPGARAYSDLPAKNLFAQIPRQDWGRLNAQEQGKVEAAWLAYKRDARTLESLPTSQVTAVHKAFKGMLQVAANESSNPILYRELAGQQMWPVKDATPAQCKEAVRTLTEGGVGALGWNREALANSLLATAWRLKAC